MFKKKYIIYLAIIFFGFFGAVSSAKAADYYVATNGNDANPGTIDQPWATPEKAWRNAQAGDTVFFRAGTYIITSQIWTKYYGYDGTAQNPINFKNYPGESVTFSSSLDPAFRIERDYNYVSGITFTGGSPTWFYVSYDTSAVGFKLSNCTAYLGTATDNHGLIETGGGANNLILENCVIVGAGKNGNANMSGIIIHRTPGVIVRNNDISSVPQGIYYKHTGVGYDTGIQFINNYIHDCSNGIKTVSQYALISNNLISGCNAGIYAGDGAGLGLDGQNNGGDHNTITHNTFYNVKTNFSRTSDGDGSGCQYNIFKDNIFMTEINLHDYSSVPHYSTLDYNLYPAGNDILENYVHYTLANWKIYYGQDAHSIASAPIFVSTLPSQISDYALASGSPGKNAASDGADMGANVSLVGLQTTSTADTTPPSAPSGLAVN